MISKQDILERAVEWGLRPEIVEKDYVLGWLLAGFAAHRLAATSWIFKGGTCLKKCFFETYRFSEDLDFSLSPAAAYDEPAIKALLTDVARYATEASGISIPVERIEVRTRRDKLGRPTYQGKVAYRGPLAMPNWPRVLFDITQHEAIADTPALRPISHPYADQLPGPRALCYSLEELFAEKTRALLERTRPRDLYDVAHLWDRREQLDIDAVRALFAKKCEAKSIAVPTTTSLIALVRSSDALRADWSGMMEQQLPSLPALDNLLARLEEILSWIDAPLPPGLPMPALELDAGDTVIAPTSAYYWGGGQRLDLVRFAGANRLKIAFNYKGKRRIAEPYSLRRKATGNLVLYAWEDGARSIKAFITSNMYDVQPTNESFIPKFRVELTG